MGKLRELCFEANNSLSFSLPRRLVARLETCILAFLPVLALVVSSAGLEAQSTDWGMLLGGAGNEIGKSVATDVDGSVVAVGSFEGQTSIGGAQLSSAGYTDAFVAKFSDSGGRIWTKRLGGTSPDEAADVSIDQDSGDVIVTGQFSLSATFDNQVLHSAGSADIFLARFSQSGVLQWARGFGSQAEDAAAGVAVDTNGDSLVAGQFRGTFTCGPTTLTSAGGTDIFVANVTIDGAVRWCRRVGGAFDDALGGIAVSGTGLVALTGTFGTATDLGGGAVSSAGFFDAFVSVYTASTGAYRWARRLGGSGYDAGNDVAFDAAGTVLLTGYFGLFGGAVDFGGGALSPQGGADAFVAKYNAVDGRYVWAGKFGGGYDDYGNALSVNPAGDVVIAGEFQGTASFAGLSAASKGQFDAFVASYSSAGAPRWWRCYGDLVNDKAYGVVADAEGNWLVTGFSIYRIDLGLGLLNSSGMADAFLAKVISGAASTPPPTPTHTPTRPAPTNTTGAHATPTATRVAPRLPQTVPNLALWLDAGQLAGLSNGAAVSTWSDASGLGHHATQLTATNRPTYRSVAVSGRPAVRFDGIDDYLRLTGTVVSGAQARTVFFVARPDVVGNKGVVDLGNGTTTGAGFLITPEYGVRINGARRLWLPSASTQAAQIGVVQMGGPYTTGLSLWVNGTLRAPGSTAIAPINTVGVGSVGTWTARPVGYHNFDGDIAEIIVYRRALNTSERQGVEQYLDAKY
jgi:hypothetical protein